MLSKERHIYLTTEIVTNRSDTMTSGNIGSVAKGNSNNIPSLPPRRTEVLKFLAGEGPLNVYQIQQKLGLPSYSTAHGAVKALENDGLLKMQALEQTEKGVTAKVYGLTFSGLALALTSEDVLTNLDKIVEFWGAIAPLPLRKYAYFARCGLKDEALKCYSSALVVAFKESFELKRMLSEFLGHEEQSGKAWAKSREEIESQFEKIWSRVFLECAIGPQPLDGLLKWYKALRGDPEVRQWVVETLRSEVSRHRAWADVKEDTQRIVEMQREPVWEEIKKQGVKWPAEISWEVRG